MDKIKLELSKEDVYTLFSWAFSYEYDSRLKDDDYELIKRIEEVSGIKFEIIQSNEVFKGGKGMNINELQALRNIAEEKEAVITIDCLNNQSDRTLLYGYDCDRNTWHTYIKNREIVTIIYDYNELPTERLIHSNSHYIPNKRLYPECCDYEFCKLLIMKDIYLPFTKHSEREQKKYYGLILP